MTTETTPLAEFLLARIAEDEELAHDTDPLMPDAVFDHDVSGWWDPARVLAECEAKRRLVEEYRREHAKARPVLPLLIPIDTAAGGALGWTLKVLALPYADHPDYRPEWRP